MENFGEFIVNHWLLWTLFFVLLAMIIATSIGGSLSGATTVSTAQAVQIVNQQKGLFVDVREEEEFNKGHIADSINIPSSSFAEKMTQLKKNKQPIIIVSRNGQGTIPVAKKLQDADFSEIYLLKGGIQTWNQERLPLFS
jgi:rhodanese-related sulfurtransferase